MPFTKEQMVEYNESYHRDGVLVSAFAGTGKTYFSLHSRELGIRVIDLDHEPFLSIDDARGRRQNPNFVSDYLAKIRELQDSGHYDVILVTYLDQIRKAMTTHDMIFQTVYPGRKLLPEYVMRLSRSGKTNAFMENFMDSWDSFMDDFEAKKDVGFRQFVLESGQYLSLDLVSEARINFGIYKSFGGMAQIQIKTMSDIRAVDELYTHAKPKEK